MTTAAQIAAVALATLSTLAAVVGAWRWYRVEPSRAFWALARSAQAAAGAQAVVAGVLAVSGFEPADGLFWLYALLPVAVSFVAEQLRLASAQTVLDARREGIETSVLLDAVTGIDAHPGDVARALDEMSAAGATLTRP